MEAVLFLVSSLVTVALNYYQVPTRYLQQIIVLILVVLLVFLGRVPLSHLSTANSKQKASKANWLRSFAILLSSLFTQLLVVSSGGFYSPFLIIIHLYALGTSFLFNLQASMVYLFLTLLALAANIYLTPQMQTLFKDDPWSVVLYLISFVVIIPLSQILTRSYHLKDTLSKMLSEYIKIGEMREDSILRGLRELIVVTDSRLKILSINNAVERALQTTNSSAISRDFLKFVPIKTSSGQAATSQDLSIDQVMRDKATRIVGGFSFTPPTMKIPFLVDIQVRPVVNTQGKITQLVFVITESQHAYINHSKSSSTEQIALKRKILIEDLRQALLTNDVVTAKLLLELIIHIDEDILLFTELTDSPVRNELVYEDIVQLLQRTLTSKQALAEALGVKMSFRLPKDEVQERALSGLQSANQLADSLPLSYFSAPISQKWFELMVEKMIELALLLSSSTVQKEVSLALRRNPGNTFNIYIGFCIQPYPGDLEHELFMENYASLGVATNLKLGSGLEGAIVAALSKQINIPILFKSRDNPPSVYLIMTLDKTISKPR